MDAKKDAGLLEPSAAIALKIGADKASDRDVSSSLSGENCACGAPMLCVRELIDGEAMIYNYSWHICLNPACKEERYIFGQTCNMGGGASLDNQDIYDCYLCGRKF